MSCIEILIIYFSFRTGTFVMSNFHSYSNQNRTLGFLFAFYIFLHFNHSFKGAFQHLPSWENNK